MNRWLRLALGMALCCTPLAVGCGDGAAPANNAENAITGVEFGTTRIGHATRKQVEARYGKPLKASRSTANAAGLDEPTGLDCVYYASEDQLPMIWQMCFDGNTGTLKRKRVGLPQADDSATPAFGSGITFALLRVIGFALIFAAINGARTRAGKRAKAAAVGAIWGASLALLIGLADLIASS